MIAGFFGKITPNKFLLKALGVNIKENRGNIKIIENNTFWACLLSDSRRHLDPPTKADSIAAVAANPVFIGTLEQGYRRASPVEWVLGLAKKGVGFFRETVNNVCAAVIEETSAGARLHLISHRLGPGRMYYRVVEGGIVFSSDARVIAKVACTPARPEPIGLWSIIIYGAVPEPITVLDEVYSVPVGQAGSFEVGESQPVYTPILRLNFDDKVETDEYACLNLAKRALITGAKLVAELKTSMTISGGIDSSLFICLMRETMDRSTQGYMLSFGLDDPEVTYARQAAAVSNTNLKVFELLQRDVIWAIRHTAESAMHPFSDFSAIPVTFLIKRIAEECPDNPWVFDGNGGDDCFGVSGQEMLGRWQRMTKLPGPFYGIASSLWLRTGLWKKHSLPDIILRKLYQASEPSAYLAPFVFGHTGMTYAEPAWSGKIRELLLDTCDVCTGTRDRDSIYANFYTVQLLHVCSRLWTAKTIGPAQYFGKSVLYPYLWRDVLDSMTRIPWQFKVHNGVAKWPLKMMLEDYMPHDFIYRRKAGFVPPWRRWLQHHEINVFVRETLLGGTGYLTAVLKEEWIDCILKHLEETDVNPPAMILNTIWGALITELWLQKTLS